MLLAGFLLLLVSPGCTVVNYCVGTHMDERRQERHCYRAGDGHMIRKGHAVTVITTAGATLHGTLAGTRTVKGQTMAFAEGDPSFAGQHLLQGTSGQPAAPGTECICLVMPDSTAVEIPLDVVYLVRAEYGPPHLWRRTLPIPGLIFDVAAILFISGAIESQ